MPSLSEAFAGVHSSPARRQSGASDGASPRLMPATSNGDSFRYLTPGVSNPGATECPDDDGQLPCYLNIWVWLGLVAPPPTQTTSGLYTIIPLSDRRLRPSRTILKASLITLVFMCLLMAVFFMVPRSVTVGVPKFTPRNWHRNHTQNSYQLSLDVSLPVYNANYYSAKIHGKLRILFYDQIAGHREIGEQDIPAARALTTLNFRLDASHVPDQYGLTILGICLLYPKKLMFVFQADLKAVTLLSEAQLSHIDTYFMVDCGSHEGLQLDTTSAATRLTGLHADSVTDQSTPPVLSTATSLGRSRLLPLKEDAYLGT